MGEVWYDAANDRILLYQPNCAILEWGLKQWGVCFDFYGEIKERFKKEYFYIGEL